MFADVAGYTRLMSFDEQGTISAVASNLENIIEPSVSNYDGRVVRIVGDGVFAEFASVVNAVECAAVLQKELSGVAAKQAGIAEIQYRIGINFGDVLTDDDDLVGEDVNIASRLESLARPGGICISGKAYDEVHQKSALSFKSLGLQKLKNIPRRVAVYEVGLTEQDGAGVKTPAARRDVSVDRPSLAVLPSRNAGDDPRSYELSDGILEDIVTELGQFEELMIIASSSSFRIEELQDSIPQIGAELGARYLVRSNVRCVDDALRVTVRLYETASGVQIWSNRYARDIANLFAVQEEVAKDIARHLPIEIELAGIKRLLTKPVESLDAYECYLSGRSLYRQKTIQTNKEAVSYLERAIELDPNFPHPYAVLGAISGIEWSYSRWGVDPTESLMKGRSLIKTALKINRALPRAHAHLAWNLLYTRDYEAAVDHLDEALLLNPNEPDVLLLKAYALCYLGNPEESLDLCRLLMRLNPHYPDWYLDVLSLAQFLTGDYEGSAETHAEIAEFYPETAGWMAALYGHLGEHDRAHAMAEQFAANIRTIWHGDPDAGLGDYIRYMLDVANPFRLDRDRNRLAEGLQKAGLPTS